MSPRSVVIGALTVLVLLTGGVRVFRGDFWPTAETREPVSESMRLKREIIDSTLARPSDPKLAKMYEEMNARHFGGDLPPMPVRWEPRLSRVDELPGETGILKGLFGAVNEKAVILLSPSLRSDAHALKAALAHEMVHAYMFRMGEDTSDHGPAFQAVLQRLTLEGAFSATSAGAPATRY